MKPEKNKVTIGSLLKAIFCVIKVQDHGHAGVGGKLCTGAATRLLGTATAVLLQVNMVRMITNGLFLYF